MTIVHGQIESLKRIKRTLNEAGIDQFNSIKEIKAFSKTFELEKKRIYQKVSGEYTYEIEQLEIEIRTQKRMLNDLLAEMKNALKSKLEDFSEERIALRKKPTVDFFDKIFVWIDLFLLHVRVWFLEKKYNYDLEQKTKTPYSALKENELKYDNLVSSKLSILRERSNEKLIELNKIQSVLEHLKPTIFGAIGENLVQKELEKLPGMNVLINDFALRFETPIYNRSTDDRIFSLQIDHLLVTQAGIFNIETKNWSKRSIDRLDMRSPVEQAQRAGFALFVLVNGRESKFLRLEGHHWGEIQIPIRNLVVMTNAIPNKEFKNVSVKHLKQLNRYISYFSPIFDEVEVKLIAEQLRCMKMDSDL